MKRKIIVFLVSIFSFTLIGCNTGVDNISLRDIVNKDIIESVKKGSEEFVENYKYVEIQDLELINDKHRFGEYLKITLSLDDEEAIKNIEKISEIYAINITNTLETVEKNISYISILWDCKDGEKTMSYIYQIDQNHNVSLEEAYIDEKRL